jgi:hypothetical protein
MLFGISPLETTFARRNFRGGEGGLRERIETIGRVFVRGYHCALSLRTPGELAVELDSVELEFRGFAYEGAAMGLALLDRITPWRRDRVRQFLRGPGDLHAYMVYVGLGWVVARIPGSIQKRLEPLDPLLRWLVLDGYGFHEGFFRWPAYLGGQFVPPRLAGYQKRAFDQGLGRSLWFVDGGNVWLLPRTIAAFPQARQPDLWSGIGLACVYAGEIADDQLARLQAASGACFPQFAQGAAFAAKARHRAGNATAYTERACQIICGMSSQAAALCTDEALENLPANGTEPAYEIWRCRVQQKFARGKELKR